MSDRERRGPRREWRGAEIVGIVLIAVGVVYLLGNLGIVRVAWSVIWPILIIVIGGVLLFGALRPSRRQASSAVVPRDGAARLELDLSVGAGRFRLEGGAPNGQLIDVTSTNDDIATRVDHAGDRAIVRLRQDFAWWPDAWRGGSEWTVRAASDVPTISSRRMPAPVTSWSTCRASWPSRPESRSGPRRHASSCHDRAARSRSGSAAGRPSSRSCRRRASSTGSRRAVA